MSAEDDNVTENVVKRIEQHTDLYRGKNEDYGGTWQKSGDIFDLMADGEWGLENADDIRDMGILVRVFDKLSRVANLRFVSDEPNYESLADSLQDAAIYLFLLAELVDDREPETEEEEKNSKMSIRKNSGRR